MEEKEMVILKSSPERLLLILDETEDFSKILAHLQGKIEKSAAFFKGGSKRLRYSGRELSGEQEAQIVNLFTSIGEMDVIDIGKEIFVPTRAEGNAFRGISYGLFDKTPEGKAIRPGKKAKGIEQIAEGLTTYYYGNLTKGQRIVYKGSVVIFGNVEKGAEVFATENVMVFGSVKGTVSVGGTQLKTAMLVCEHFAAEGFEIAQIQQKVPDFFERVNAEQKRGLFQKKRPNMKMLYLVDNCISIAPLSSL